MLKRACVQTSLLIFMVLLLPYGSSYGRPRRRFCENYPFAPRCLGVAAKRSLEYDFSNRVTDDVSNRAAPVDIYSTIIKRVLDEAKRPHPAPPGPEDPTRRYDGSIFLDKLTSLINKPQSELFETDAYSNGADNWNSRFNDNERGL